MKNFEKIIEFVRNNRVLTLVMTVAFLLIVSVIFTSQSLKKKTDDKTINVEYQLLAKTQSFEYYIYKDKYYVFTKDPSKQDKDTIRATLGIDKNIDFELILPNASNPNPVKDSTITITPPANCCD